MRWKAKDSAWNFLCFLYFAQRKLKLDFSLSFVSDCIICHGMYKKLLSRLHSLFSQTDDLSSLIWALLRGKKSRCTKRVTAELCSVFQQSHPQENLLFLWNCLDHLKTANQEMHQLMGTHCVPNFNFLKAKKKCFGNSVVNEGRCLEEILPRKWWFPLTVVIPTDTFHLSDIFHFLWNRKNPFQEQKKGPDHEMWIYWTVKVSLPFWPFIRQEATNLLCLVLALMVVWSSQTAPSSLAMDVPQTPATRDQLT